MRFHRMGFHVVVATAVFLSSLSMGVANDVQIRENVALNKPYTLSAAPNYDLCKDADDASQLTDGIYTKGYFWTQKSTVGWASIAPVFCTIDLGKVEPIRGVSWSCAAGVAGVTWPECLYVLVSDDNQSWTYLGDLCVLGTESKVPPVNGYSQFRYETGTMKGRGRYVCVIAAARPFCFVDEIEVWRGDNAWLQGSLPGQKVTDLKEFFAIARVRSGVAGRLRDDLASILAKMETRLDTDTLATLKIKAAGLKDKIPAFAEKLPESQKTALPYGALHEAILALHAPVLRAAGVTNPLVWQNNRWSPLSLIELPSPDSGVDNITLDLMRGEVRGEVFNITNPEESPLDVALTITGLPAALNIEVREVLFTDTQSRTPVAAALRRLQPDANRGFRLRVPGGGTRQVWLSCRRPRIEARTYNGIIAIASADGRFSRELALKVRVRNLNFPKQPALHVGGWDYTQGKGDYNKTPGNLPANLAFMRDMYVDSPWATSAVFPKGAKFDGKGLLLNEKELDFSVWDEWVKRWTGARQYCVFFNVGDIFNGEKMGTQRFNRMVGEWMGAWTRHLKKKNLRPEQLVILLLDEPHTLEQDAVIVTWAAAIKAAKLGVVLFEDPTHADPSKGDPAMFAASDVLCPNTPMMLQHGEPFREFYRRQHQSGKTLWLYSCSGPSRLLDPIAYYRVQAWLAFQMRAQGSFYWAFGCGGGIGDSWRAYAHTQQEFSPYFVSSDSVMEGKHSEAIREGVQDYEYLCMLREKVRKTKAEGGDAGWLARAEALLTDGVEETVKAAKAAHEPYLFQTWMVEKDRSAMDAVRMQALDLLEMAPAP